MKALIQRVSKASVAVDGQEVARIGGGLVVLVRIFADEAGKFNLSARDVKAELLLVSQFTLLADTRKGRRPSFASAAPPDRAGVLFEEFVSQARASGLSICRLPSTTTAR